MSEVHACTVITRNRLAHARVLAHSFLEHHPGGTITALLVDDVNREVDPAGELLRIVHPGDAGLDSREFHRMATIYDALEMSCALKPWALAVCLNRSRDAVLYLDSDVEVFAPLDDLRELAKAHQVVVTPHQTDPLPPPPAVPPPPFGFAESSMLLGGCFNNGFVAVGPTAAPFLDWWASRLARHCLNQPERGYFVDQHWVDLAPGYFDVAIARDRGCNVAAWNLPSRHLHRAPDRTTHAFRVGDTALRFFHWAGFDPTTPWLLSRWVPPLPATQLSNQPLLAELTRNYLSKLNAAGHRQWSRRRYHYDRLPNGVVLDRPKRRIYREALLAFERGLAPEPPCPFETPPQHFLSWLASSSDSSPRA